MTADIAQVELHRAALTGHCYRMLGSSTDADDAAQETIIRAWKALDNFDGRASLKTWLYRIATNVCLDALSGRTRRERPMEGGPSGTVSDTLVALPRRHWIEPVLDAKVLPRDASPAEILMLKQSIRLAFVAALQNLPPKQRAVLLLTDVLGWSASETAECLETTLAAVNSALQRARATMGDGAKASTEPLSPQQLALLDRYVDAFESYDVETLVSLLRDDVTFSMPPYSLWLSGPEPVRNWLLGRGCGCRGSRLIPTAACGSPAFGQYRAKPGGGHTAWALVVLELAGDRIGGWNSFLETSAFFPLFGLPTEIS